MTIADTLGKYTIEHVLGEGAMSTVYKAQDPSLDEPVAIKVIRPELLRHNEHQTFLERFRREALICRKLKHPNIVSTYDYSDGTPSYIVMEYVDGQQLKDLLDQQQHFDPEAACQLMVQILGALEYAHQEGVVHRDLKPANIMIAENHKVLVADFGIAKLDQSNLTLDGSIIGSPNYMSPEQCMGKSADSRSDLFSAGVILYHLLTGHKPFEDDGYMGTMRKVVELDPPKPSAQTPEIPAALDTVVEKSMAKNPEERFRSAAEFRHALEAACCTQQARQRTPWLLPGLLTVAGLGIGALLYQYYSPRNTSTAAVSTVVPNVQPEPIQTSATANGAAESAYETGTPAIAPEDKPSTTERLASVRELLNEIPCSQLDAELDDQGGFTISGHAKPVDIPILESMIEEEIGAVRYTSNVSPMIWPYCEVAAILHNAEQRNRSSARGLALSPHQHDSVYQEGEFLKYDITTPDYPAFIYVDYYQPDGMVTHMLPYNAEQNHYFQANQRQILGQTEDGQNLWEVYPPFGQDFSTIIASATALFESPRERTEPAQDYLPALRAALSTAEPSTITANHSFIQTQARSDTHND